MNKPTKKISPAELAALQAQGRARDFIDVRTPVEFAEAHATGARLATLGQWEPQDLLASRQATDEPMYIICKSGGRAAQACEKLAAAGFSDAVCVEGGTEAWQHAALPIVCNKKVISLERQVRIAAGTLVLIGVILGTLVHPWLYGLCAFVGAGLVFAGISNTCLMGLLLAKLPFNQKVQHEN